MPELTDEQQPARAISSASTSPCVVAFAPCAAASHPPRRAARCRSASAITEGGGGGPWKARLTQSTRAMSSVDTSAATTRDSISGG
eukprot:7378125-Prymnesium_polylepis.2